MDRVRRLTVFLAVFLFALFSAGAFADTPLAPDGGGGLWPNQSIAYSHCVSDAAKNDTAGGGFCRYNTGGSASSRSECLALGGNMGSWTGSYSSMNASKSVAYNAFYWCVPADCSVYDSGASSQQWSGVYQNGTVYCSGGCMSLFHMQSGVGSIQFTNGDGGSWGHFSGNGNRCNSSIDSLLFKPAAPAPPLCDHGSTSCYNPSRGFCATTEYGEVICTPAPPPGSGGCTAGATGATCAGNDTPPPTPPDPPIQKDQPPSSSGNATGKDASGNTYNYITNNYSGTSPGGSASSSSSSGAAGSQSNTSGSGNSPGPNGSAGTNSTGKCADGSVPTASGCSGTASDTGCDTPPQCFGDAVMCAQFKEQVAIRCNTAKPAGALSVGSPSAALAAAGVPGDGGASSDPSTSGLVSSSDLGSDGFDASGLGFSRTCPANPQFSVLGRTYTLDLTPFCNFASLLGWFVLLVAFLVGLRIVATGKA